MSTLVDPTLEPTVISTPANIAVAARRTFAVPETLETQLLTSPCLSGPRKKRRTPQTDTKKFQEALEYKLARPSLTATEVADIFGVWDKIRDLQRPSKDKRTGGFREFNKGRPPLLNELEL
jgi:hypothetical protein